MIWEVDQRERSIEGLDADGRPDPAYAAGLGLVAAPYGRRALSFVCDVAFWLVLQLPLWIGAVPLLLKLATGSISPYGFVNHPDFVLAVVCAAVSAFLLLVLGVVQWVLHGRKGVTVGKAIGGIRTVNVATLARPGMGRVLLRFVVVGAFTIVPVVGPIAVLLSPTFDPSGRGRGWHDRVGRVWLVDVRAGLNPYDEKRMRIARKTVAAVPVAERSELPSLATSRDGSGQPEYRPGGRISAGVLGVARPRDAAETRVAPAVPAPAAAVGAAPAALPPLAAPPIAAPVAQPVAAPVAPPRPAAPAAPAVALILDTGERIDVTGPVLLGRAPDASGRPGAQPIAIADESRSLSKTHVLLRPAATPSDAGIEIVDCRSTNGCALIRGGVEYELEPEVPVIGVVGEEIRLGDRLARIVGGER